MENEQEKKTESIEEMANTLLAEKSDVSQHVVDEVLAEDKAINDEKRIAEIPPSMTPKSEPDTVFDPSLHMVDSSGTPIKNRFGKYRRKPGRKKGVDYPTNKGTVTDSQSKIFSCGTENSGIPPVASQSESNAGLIMLAGISTHTFIAVGSLAMGEDFAPGPGEPEYLNKLFADYFAAAGVEDISPGWALLIGLGSYAAQKAVKPKAQGRLAKIKEWFFNRKNKDTRKSYKPAPEKEAENASFDSGSNNVGENVVGKADDKTSTDQSGYALPCSRSLARSSI